MNCKFCNKTLTNSQVYEFIRGKSKGYCSRKCASLSFNYKSISELPNYLNKRILFNLKCIVCKKEFDSVVKNQKTCNVKCAGVLSSKRMTEKNPMLNKEVRKKVSDTLKKIGHKPIYQGGNGRGNTAEQKLLYDELIKIKNGFVCEYIFKTKGLNKERIYPSHYKIDLALEESMLAIEIDGASHNSLKIKECDKKKTNLLISQGWKVLRLSNLQIQKELKNCVLMVMSMI
jgi:very-short-patch-repair endonuclease